MGGSQNYQALDWVQSEIEQTLKQAQQALEAFVENPDDSTRMRFCLTHLHQIYGTLKIVEFYGATLLAEEMEQLAQAFLAGAITSSDDAVQILMQAILQLPVYLDQVKSERKEEPANLLPLLNELRSARGERSFSEGAFFQPDVSVAQSAVRPSEVVFKRIQNLPTILAKIRQLFQYALVGLFKEQDVATNYAYLIKATVRMYDVSKGTAQSEVWYCAAAMLEGLSEGKLPLTIPVKQTLTELDKFLKAVCTADDFEQAPAAPDALLRDILFYVAKAGECASARVAQVQDKYDLRALWAEQANTAGMNKGPDKTAIKSVVVALEEEMGVIKETLDLFVRGDQDDLDDLNGLLPHFKQIADTLAILGLTAQRKLVQDQIELVSDIVAQGSVQDEKLLLSVADNLVEVEASLAHLMGDGSGTGDGANEALRMAREAVLKESRGDLDQAKEGIAQFIHSDGSLIPLKPVPGLLHSVQGSISMVPLPQCELVLDRLSQYVAQELIEKQSEPDAESMELLADALTSVEYYLERFDLRGDDDRSMLDIAEKALEGLGYAVDGTPASHEMIADTEAETAGHEPALASEADAQEVPNVAETESLGLQEVHSQTAAEQGVAELDEASTVEIGDTDADAAESLSIDALPAEPALGADATHEPAVAFDAEPPDFEQSSLEQASLEESSLEQPEFEAPDFGSPEVESPELESPAVGLQEGGLQEVELQEVESHEFEPAEAYNLEAEPEPEPEPERELPPVVVDLTPVSLPVLEGSYLPDPEPEPEPEPELVVEPDPEPEPEPEIKVEVADFVMRRREEAAQANEVGDSVADASVSEPLDLPAAEDVSATELPDLEASETEASAPEEDADPIINIGAMLQEGADDDAEALGALEAALPPSTESEPEPEFLQDAPTETPALEVEPAQVELSEPEASPVAELPEETPEETPEEAGASAEPEEIVLAQPEPELETEPEPEPQAAAPESVTETMSDATDAEEDEPEEVDDGLPRVSIDLDAPLPALAPEASETEEWVDEDVVEIFVEESEEVLEAVADFYPRWRANNDDVESLKEVRRAFHTLKGSGRMVGANVIGEVSWAVENMLNRVLDRTISLSPAVYSIIDRALECIPVLVEAFQDQQPTPLDIQPLLEASEVIAKGGVVVKAKKPKVVEAEPEAPAAEATDEAEQSQESALEADGFDPVLLEIFKEEALSHLSAMREFLSESGGIDASPTNELLRALHTLKGCANMAGITTVADVMTPIERVVRRIHRCNQLLDRKFQEFLKRMSLALSQKLQAVVSDPHRLVIPQEPFIIELKTHVERCLTSEQAEGVFEGVDIGGVSPFVAKIFLTETLDHLLNADQQLRACRADVATAPDVLGGLAAVLTSLRFSAQDAGLVEVATLVRSLEYAYRSVQEGIVPADDTLFAMAHEGHDALIEMMDCVANGLSVVSADSLSTRLLSIVPPEAAAKFDALPKPQVQRVAPETSVGEGEQGVEAPVAELSLTLDPEVVEIFLDEALDIMASADKLLKEWRNEPANHLRAEELQRDLHTLKGGARLAEVTPVGDLAARLETLYEGVCDERFKVSEELFDLLSDCHHAIDGLMSALQAEAPMQNPAVLLERADLFIDRNSGDFSYVPESAAPEAPEAEAPATETHEPDVAVSDVDTAQAPTADLVADVPEERLEELPDMHAPLDEAAISLESPALPEAPELTLPEAPDDAMLLDAIPGDEVPGQEASEVPSLGALPELDTESLGAEPDDFSLPDLHGAAPDMSLDPAALGEPDLGASELSEPDLGEPELDASALSLEPPLSSEPDFSAEPNVDADLAPEAVSVSIDDFAETDPPEDLPSVDVTSVSEAEAQPAPVAANEVALGDNVDPEVVEIFLEEASDIVASATNLLRDWRADIDNVLFAEELQRDLHTLKGGARLAEIEPLSEVAHRLEALYEGVCDNRFPPNDVFMSHVQLCHDLIEKCMQALRHGAHLPDPAAVLAQVDQFFEENTGFSYQQAESAPSLEDVSAQAPSVEPQLVDADASPADQPEQAEVALAAPAPAVPAEQLVSPLKKMLGDDFDNLDVEVFDIFLEEAEELTEQTDEALNAWLAEPDNEEHGDLMKRLVHTFKGGARLAGLRELGDLSHDFETFLECMPEGPPDSEFLQKTQHQFDQVAHWVTELRKAMLQHEEGMLVAPDGQVVSEDAVAEAPTAEPASAAPESTTHAQAVTEAPIPEESTNVEISEPPQASLPAISDVETVPELPALDASAPSEVPELNVPELDAPELDAPDLDAPELEADAPTLVQAPDDLPELPSLTAEAPAAATPPEPTAPAQSVVNEDAVAAFRQSSGTAAPAPTVTSKPKEAPESPAEIAAKFASADGNEAVPLVLVDLPYQKESSAAAPVEPKKRDIKETRRGGGESVKVQSNLLEKLINLAGETSIFRGRIENEVSRFHQTIGDMGGTIDRLRDLLRRLDIETEAHILYRHEKDKEDYEDFDPLEMDRYSALNQLSRSLSESASDLMDLTDTMGAKVRDAETLLVQQSRVNTELQEGLMRTQLEPFSKMIPRLRRIVRQVAAEVGKQVELEVVNAEGELDRNVLDRMVAPLEHMLRNAVDHGIETPAEREAANKSPQGRITLFLAREGGEVVLRLSDDGKGIATEAVKEKAISKGLMKPDAVLSDNEIMQFIFRPGFSTASKVTQISGRGVGMDVVNSEIKQLGGNMKIHSAAGVGTQFTVRLPFTVSVNRALMVVVGEDYYAIPLSNIEGIVRVSPYELMNYYKPDAPQFGYAGRQYTMEYLGRYVHGKAIPPLDGITRPLPVLLLRSGESSVALQVDQLLGSREVVVKSLGPQLSTVSGISGATILGDGNVVIILDLLAMLRAGKAGSQDFVDVDGDGTDEATAETRKTPLVMVVDDSVTVRKVTSRLLERHGLDVVLAKDGMDAISKLQEVKPDIMLLDIEMPRMDGFEVASQVRHSDRLKDLPIIMITSRTGEKHRNRALSLGVNKYMGKPFQETQLLENIQSLLKQEIQL